MRIGKMAVTFLVAVCSALYSINATAEDSINVFGVLEVHSKATNTIVSVPWVQLGYATNDAIRVCDLVLTNNLSAGDTIVVYDLDTRTENQAYEGWVLSNGGWASIVTVTENEVVDAPKADTARLRRGKAFMLSRRHPIEGGTAVPFYLCGQYTDANADGVEIAAGTMQTPVYHFLAAPYVEDKNLNDIGWNAANIGENDTILLPQNASDGATIIYNFDSSAGKWYYSVKSGRKMVKTYGGTIPAGTGFWYISRGGSMTLAW